MYALLDTGVELISGPQARRSIPNSLGEWIAKPRAGVTIAKHYIRSARLRPRAADTRCCNHAAAIVARVVNPVVSAFEHLAMRCAKSTRRSPESVPKPCTERLPSASSRSWPSTKLPPISRLEPSVSIQLLCSKLSGTSEDVFLAEDSPRNIQTRRSVSNFNVLSASFLSKNTILSRYL